MLGKIFVSLLLLSVMTGCQTTAVNTSYNSNYVDYDQSSRPIENVTITSPIDTHTHTVTTSNDLWQLTRDNLKFTDAYSNARVVSAIKKYNRYPLHMTKVSKQASPYYYYVLQEVLKRDFPSEVALLPVIESLYNPSAYSHGKASGIWQFIPSTATYLGIDINDWYDGRRDVITSTQTALDYLASLNKRFNGDWMLTFAAYNGGGGTVSKAIRKNREQGLATDYWSLKLPAETTQYVPKILAIAAIVENPNAFNIKLPSISNTPYFTTVDTGGQIALTKVASMSNVSIATIRQLNPGFNRNITAPTGPHRVLVPIKQSAKLQRALSTLATAERLKWQRYKVQSGDSLGVIAERFNVSVAMLKDTNSLTSSKIRRGKTLLIPTVATGELAQETAETNADHKLHTINDGDTVWDIAKKHKMSVKEILAFNGLSQNSTLKVGSSIKIPRG